MATFYFMPPVIERPVGRDRLWARFNFNVGQALLKFVTESPHSVRYELTETPTDEDVLAADLVYLGSRWVIVDDAEAADLRAAGYGGGLYPTDPGDIGDGGYGDGSYGTGPYGEANPSYGGGPFGSGPFGH